MEDFRVSGVFDDGLKRTPDGDIIPRVTKEGRLSPEYDEPVMAHLSFEARLDDWLQRIKCRGEDEFVQKQFGFCATDWSLAEWEIWLKANNNNLSFKTFINSRKLFLRDRHGCIVALDMVNLRKRLLNANRFMDKDDFDYLESYSKILTKRKEELDDLSDAYDKVSHLAFDNPERQAILSVFGLKKKAFRFLKTWKFDESISTDSVKERIVEEFKSYVYRRHMVYGFSLPFSNNVDDKEPFDPLKIRVVQDALALGLITSVTELDM